MTTVVYFVRHAEPNYNNHDDIKRELSPKGSTEKKYYSTKKGIE